MLKKTQFRNSISLILAFVMLFASSISLFAIETVSNPSVVFQVSSDIEMTGDLKEAVEVAIENFTEGLKQVRQMGFENQEEKMAAIYSLYIEHFELVSEIIVAIRKNSVIYDDHYYHRGPVGYWVADIRRQWIQSSPNWVAPSSIFHSQFVPSRGMMMEGWLEWFNFQIFIDDIVPGRWIHTASYSGLIFPSGLGR